MGYVPLSKRKCSICHKLISECNGQCFNLDNLFKETLESEKEKRKDFIVLAQMVIDALEGKKIDENDFKKMIKDYSLEINDYGKIIEKD